MLKRRMAGRIAARPYLLAFGICTMFFFMGWALWAPAWPSIATLGWLTAGTFGLFTILMALRAPHLTRSMAPVFHNSKQQSET